MTAGRPKGGTKSGGRQAGTPNKSTSLAREAIARFVDDNSQRMQGWLDQIAADSPEKAFNCVRDLMEYHLPKMARTEVQPLDERGEPSNGFTLNVNMVKK